MPQIKLEYTSNIKIELDKEQLLLQIHKSISESGIDINNCKSRLIKIDDFLVGENKLNKFVHLEVKILEGREQSVKNEIGNNLLNLLSDYFKEAGNNKSLQITVELMDIQKNSYYKSVL